MKPQHNRKCKGTLDPLWKITWSTEKKRSVIKKSMQGNAALLQCNKCEKVVKDVKHLEAAAS